MSPPFGKLIVLCAILLSVLGGSAAFSQESTDPVVEGLHNQAQLFLEDVAQDKVEIAYQELLRDSPLLKQFEQSEGLRKLIERTNELKVKYGECRKVERVAARRLGSNVVVLRYLYQCEFYPIVWHFVFYRTPPRGDMSSALDPPWRLITVRFDTELEKLVE